MNKKSGVLDKILNIDYIIASVALTVLVIVTFGGVLMRYYYKQPITWQEEVQVLCMLWIVFMGASVAFRHGGHIAIDVLVDLMPKPMRKVIGFLGDIVVLLVLVYLLKQSMVLIGQLERTNSITSILKIRNSWIKSAVPIGCVLMMVNQVILTIKRLKGHDLEKEGM